jgi:EAL domain-containing protein (putative c-di-GMP-specific phosphodiesterase class I)
MGNALGLQVVAEGVETADQLSILRTLGCDVIQGYYYSKPLPLDKLLHYTQGYLMDHKK